MSQEKVTPPPFVITVSARALFDLEESHKVFTEQGTEEFERYQQEHEEIPLGAGPAMQLVQKLLSVNADLPEDAPRFEVILLSRNSPETGLRVLNTIDKMGLDIQRAVFTSGASTSAYIQALGTQLFLSSNPVEVAKAIDAGIGAANITPKPGVRVDDRFAHQIRIAFDGDAVLFSDQAERAHCEGGLPEFHKHERARADEALPAGPFRPFLEQIHAIQSLFPANDCPVRTALVTARAAPMHRRPIRTLREWGVRVDEAFFLAGRNKGPLLKSFGADLFFDDSQANIDLAVAHDVPSGHVPYGARNQVGADETKFTGGEQAIAQRAADAAELPPGALKSDKPKSDKPRSRGPRT